MNNMENKTMSFEDIRKMRKGTNSYEIMNFPFTNIPIGVRVLSQDEIMRAINKGREVANLELKNPNNTEELEFSMRELLYKAIIKIPTWDERDSFFSKSSDLWELSVDEWTELVNFYNTVQEKYAPQHSLKEPADFDNLIEEVKKKSPTGMSLSSHMLQQLLQYMIARSEWLLNDNDTISMPAKISEANESKKNIIKPETGIRIEGKAIERSL